MRRLAAPLLCFVASCGPNGNTSSCPDFPAAGDCDADTARWCDATTQGQPPAAFNCGTIDATCGRDPAYGAWCAATVGGQCAATRGTSLAMGTVVAP